MKNLSFLFAILAILSCEMKKGAVQVKDPAAEDEAAELSLYEEMMEMHDVAMPKMDDIMEMKGLLKEELERMEGGVEAVREEREKALRELLKALDDADDAMMQWMREDAIKPADSIAHQEAMKILRESLEKIEEVNSQMDQAIKGAKGNIKQE